MVSCYGSSLHCLAYKGYLLVVGLPLAMSHSTSLPCVPLLFSTLPKWLFPLPKWNELMTTPSKKPLGLLLGFWPLGVACGMITGSFCSGAHIVDVLLTQRVVAL